MKISIALTLIITVAIFSFISGYSISAHNKQGAGQTMASQGSFVSAATAAENTSTPSAGNNSPSSEKTIDARGSSPGYGSPSPGYGQ
jgi:hypothetical protein